MSVSHKLKARRKELGLTMLEVAKKIGVSEATVSRWESGNIENMRLDKIAALAKALQVPSTFITEETILLDDCTLTQITLYPETSKQPNRLLGKTDIKNPLPKTEEQIVYSFEGEGSSKQPFDKSKLLSLAELNEAASNLSVEQIKRITDFIKDMNKN